MKSIKQEIVEAAVKAKADFSYTRPDRISLCVLIMMLHRLKVIKREHAVPLKATSFTDRYSKRSKNSPQDDVGNSVD